MVANARLGDRVKKLEEEIQRLKEADERQRSDLRRLMKKILPRVAKERQEAGLSLENLISETPARKMKNQASEHLDLLKPAQELQKKQEKGAFVSKRISQLCKRVPENK